MGSWRTQGSRGGGTESIIVSQMPDPSQILADLFPMLTLPPAAERIVHEHVEDCEPLPALSKEITPT